MNFVGGTDALRCIPRRASRKHDSALVLCDVNIVFA